MEHQWLTLQQCPLVDLSCMVQTQSMDAQQNATIKSSKLMPIMTHRRYWYLSNKWKPWHMAVSFLSFVLSLILSPSKIKIIIIIIIIITNIIIVVPPTTFFHFSFFFKIQIIVVALKIWSYSWFDLWHLTRWKKRDLDPCNITGCN